MRFSITPEMSSPRRMAAIAGLLTVVASVWQLALGARNAVRTLGDTDDAMRIVLVRDLLHGRGWYDQLMTRIDPPHGLYFHWSRLVDGALAGLMWFAGLFLSPAEAELAVRLIWPLLWMFPALYAALVIARNLGTRSAVLIAAVLVVTELQLYRQFTPGRVDHHDIQITCALAVLAIATLRDLKPWLAAAAGALTALGLAVGLEALLFHAVVGASFAYRMTRDRASVRAGGAYGLALAAGAVGLYAIQTPPWRWDLMFCDALGVNLVIGLAVAGLGFAAIARFSDRLSSAWRSVLVGGVGLSAAAIYLAMDPACIHGPFAHLDPRLYALWLDHVDELRPWTYTYVHQRASAVHSMTVMVMVLAAAAFVWWRKRRVVPEGIAFAIVAVACVCAFRYARIEDYAFWFGLPVLAAAMSVLAERWLGNLLVPTVLATIVLSPIFIGAGLGNGFSFKHNDNAVDAQASGLRCFDNASFDRLARLPRGLVLADIDLGPAILANTPHDILIGPYHRLSKEILTAYDTLHAPPAAAEPRVRQLKVTYIVHCMHFQSRQATGLLAELHSGRHVSWLTKVSRPGEINQIWRVNAAP